MPRKRNFFNIKTHLEHFNLIYTCYEKYGDCPIFKTELERFYVMNKAILNNHAKKNTRKDIRA